ncbi:hypothetical protein CC85DRAFT_285249 [Cutaneotrichosporon oleaginosum]|uniref:Uncharacterized protein n=1 Tax=Cutaneotrichosporon oleaginosum TaxID=879819 RepID=A0A0J1B4U9_9TREE|nr:uncharacterized protein CC85DRAFT_285249 [Cutaneotrichosporon oleaginosum]KLT42709.1 hypothetical protein CC85DRAFT_285249 [Cutaneotrichosporon oleaginosum]TXT09572.1 hypothetical protein COLE_03506 [Cutaneotrichosporon oleaginosum]
MPFCGHFPGSTRRARFAPTSTPSLCCALPLFAGEADRRRGQCFAMIARAVGLHCWQPTPLIPMASIGWDAIKAVLWNAQRYPTSIVKVPISRHSKPREQHAAFFTEQANLLKQATCEMFVDVPDHLRSPFFRFNMWNEHHEGC